MTHRHTLTILALLAFMVGCQKPEIVEPNLEGDKEITHQLLLKASYDTYETNPSKVEMTNKGLSMYFEEGDKIGVHISGSNGTIPNIEFTAKNTTEDGCDFVSSLIVQVEDGYQVNGVYPYEGNDTKFDIESWTEDGMMTKTGTQWEESKTVQIASEQIMPSENDFTALDNYIILSAEPTTIEEGSATLVFSPVTAQVNIQLQNNSGSTMTINEIKLATASNPDVSLTGEFNLDLTASPKLSNSEFALSPATGKVSNSVTLKFNNPITLSAGANTELYFVTNAFSATSLTLTVYTDAGRHIIKKDFAADKQEFTRQVRRHIAFSATSATFVDDSSLNDLGFTPHVDGEMYDTYKGLVMAGYQGWQNCPGDGSLCSTREGMDKWAHYVCTYPVNDADGNAMPFRFEKGALGNAFTFWPDCSEYTNTYEAPGFTYPDGTQAHLFSSYDEQTVMTHFRWMKEYGIDGVFAQRFMVYVNKGNVTEYDHHNINLDHQMKASNEYGRAISIMYDLVGTNVEAHLTPEYLMNDLNELEAKYNFKDRSKGQKYYLYHNGKPLVGLVSFAQMDMPYNMTECRRCVELLQEAGYSVMIGVPTYWRDGGEDSPYTTELLAMIEELKPDVLMPWFVGRYDYNGETKPSYKGSATITGFDDFKARIKDDADWCRARGVDYAPNVWPGFDWSHQRPASLPYDRHGGDFLWKQAYYDIAVAGVEMIYIAMFDEIDEGTAIFKTLRKSDAPSNVPDTDYYVKYVDGVYTNTGSQGPGTLENLFNYNKENKWWVKSSEIVPTFNGVEDEYESDHYLWLTGQIRAMLRGEIPMTETRPTR